MPLEEDWTTHTHACTNAHIQYTRARTSLISTSRRVSINCLSKMSMPLQSFNKPFQCWNKALRLRLSECSPQTRFDGETPDRSSRHPEAEFILHIWCHISREEIDTATFLSRCDCGLFSSRLYIYLMSAGNPLSLKVCVSSANGGPACLKRRKYISEGQAPCHSKAGGGLNSDLHPLAQRFSRARLTVFLPQRWEPRRTKLKATPAIYYYFSLVTIYLTDSCSLKWVLFNVCEALSVQLNPGRDVLQSIPLILQVHSSFLFHKYSKLSFCFVFFSRSSTKDGWVCLFSV